MALLICLFGPYLETSKEIDHVRFIEVKKPREPLSEDQVNELHYLNFDLKVKARVLRLREARPLSQ